MGVERNDPRGDAAAAIHRMYWLRGGASDEVVRAREERAEGGERVAAAVALSGGSSESFRRALTRLGEGQVTVR